MSNEKKSKKHISTYVPHEVYEEMKRLWPDETIYSLVAKMATGAVNGQRKKEGLDPL